MEFSAEGMRALADKNCWQNTLTQCGQLARYIKERAECGYYDLSWEYSIDLGVIAKLRAAGFEVRPNAKGHVISWHSQRK